jgi:hypothetical protein
MIIFLLLGIAVTIAFTSAIIYTIICVMKDSGNIYKEHDDELD